MITDFLIFFSPTDLAVTFWKSDNKMPHHTSNASLHYIVSGCF